MSSPLDKPYSFRETGGSVRSRQRKNFLDRGDVPQKVHRKTEKLSRKWDCLGDVWGVVVRRAGPLDTGWIVWYPLPRDLWF